MSTSGIADLTLAFAAIAPTRYRYIEARADEHGALHVWVLGHRPGWSIELCAAWAYDPDAEEIERRVSEAKQKLAQPRS